MTINPKHKAGDVNVNCIARKTGTGKVDPVYYSSKAPHNQPFFRNVKKAEAM